MLLPTSEYEKINTEFQLHWGKINGPILAHQRFVNTKKGNKQLVKKIKNNDYGICKVCSSPLVPVGQRNKPMMHTAKLWCLSCEEQRGELPEDGANFGSWLDDEIIGTIVETSVEDDLKTIGL